MVTVPSNLVEVRSFRLKRISPNGEKLAGMGEARFLAELGLFQQIVGKLVGRYSNRHSKSFRAFINDTKVFLKAV